MSENKIVFVTGNVNKLKEVKTLLEGINYELVNEPLDLVEVQDSELELIAKAKVAQAIEELGPGTRVFVEDTALCFNAMNGLPGAYVKWFVQKMGLEKMVQSLNAFEDKTGTAVTTIAYSDAKGQIHVFQGCTDGTIVAKRGPETFGWDCIFEPFNTGKTYAEMTKPEKNLISHRGKAFAKFKDFLATN